MRQNWFDLAFIHWEIPIRELRKWIPSSLEIDSFDACGWIGLVPFGMRGVTPRGLPAVPALSDFPEMNVRTYVIHKNKPGVWFFSLDVTNPLAVLVARGMFHLPYFLAQMDLRSDGNWVDYACRYDQRVFRARYEPISGQRIRSRAFARWATERYCLYTTDREGTLYRGEIHHRQWPLECAHLEVDENTYLDPFPVGSRQEEVLFSRSIDVVVWPLKKLDL